MHVQVAAPAARLCDVRSRVGRDPDCELCASRRRVPCPRDRVREAGCVSRDCGSGAVEPGRCRWGQSTAEAGGVRPEAVRGVHGDRSIRIIKKSPHKSTTVKRASTPTTDRRFRRKRYYCVV